MPSSVIVIKNCLPDPAPCASLNLIINTRSVISGHRATLEQEVSRVEERQSCKNIASPLRKLISLEGVVPPPPPWVGASKSYLNFKTFKVAFKLRKRNWSSRGRKGKVHSNPDRALRHKCHSRPSLCKYRNFSKAQIKFQNYTCMPEDPPILLETTKGTETWNAKVTKLTFSTTE